VEHCKRKDGSLRAWFRSQAEAEAFAADPANHPVYLGDQAHLCERCGFWHLSRAEWLGLKPRYFCIKCKKEIVRSENGEMEFYTLPGVFAVCRPCALLMDGECSPGVN